eukprot:SM000100S09432  [mRNA]  locus=s100:342551:344632:- [translate_table: standard]
MQGLFSYSRHHNPNVYQLARGLAALEGTEAAICTSSGMAAISSVLMQLLSAGDHLVASSKLYGGTYCFLKNFAPRFNIQVTLVDIGNLKEVEGALSIGKTKILYFETLSNPSLTMADIPSLCSIAKKASVKTIVDNTFTPLVCSPAKWGVDIVIHSLTKFINGTSDIVAGAICGPKALIDQLTDPHSGNLIVLGGTMDANVAWEIQARLPHLGLRMKEQSSRALVFARRLHSLGIPVLYPGLSSHPGHEVFSRLKNSAYGYGGMLGVDLGSKEKANHFMECCQNESRFGILGVSLGYHETLLCRPAGTVADGLSPEEQQKAGISVSLVRVSVGITGSVEQRWAQLFETLVSLRLVKEGSHWEE